jgi:hypothetical protein
LLKKCRNELSPSQTGKVIYGLSLIDMSWKDLEDDKEMEQNIVDSIVNACGLLCSEDSLNDEVYLQTVLLVFSFPVFIS